MTWPPEIDIVRDTEPGSVTEHVPSLIRHITIDCANPYELSRFWERLVGFGEDPDDPNLPEHEEALILDPTGRCPGLLFIEVPEPKHAKNRIHLDLVPMDVLRDVAVDDALARGASIADDRRNDDGTGWVVMFDPEGNEFCIEGSLIERPIAPAKIVTEHRPQPGVHTSDERAMLTGMLDWYREGVIAKVEGLDEPAARRSLVASPTTPIGIVKHLALVEDFWFVQRFSGGDPIEPWASAPWDDDPDWDFSSAKSDSLADVVDLYRSACERSRATAASADLDDHVASPSLDFTLRWLLLHMIEETARHLGHLDILRELADGVTGR
jgi:hypothetical protein